MADQHDDGGLTALVMQCAFAVIAGQKTVTISSTAGKAPAGFPRGELLSVGTNGAHNYAVCPIKALAWVHVRTSGVASLPAALPQTKPCPECSDGHPGLMDDGSGGFATCDECGGTGTATSGVPASGAPLNFSDGWQMFVCYLIDKCEGETVSEEMLHRAVAKFITEARYNTPAAGVQGTSNDQQEGRDAS